MSLSRRIPVLQEISRLLRGEYPRFVTAARPAPLGEGEVPVFLFHTVAAGRFEAHLRFLAANGYGTLNADQLHAFITGAWAPRRPSVALTFDDGETSWRRVALPLLLKYGFTAVGFVSPALLRRESEPAGGGKQWLAWSELGELHRSGAFDIQSHTLRHERMFAGDRVVDFLRPGFFQDGLGLDRPWVSGDGGDCRLTELGSPLFPLGSRMSDERKFLDCEAVRSACVAHVAAHGGASYFDRPGWRRQLRAVFDAQRGISGGGRFETEDEQRGALRKSLRESRRLLEERLGKRVLDLAYPWGVGGELAAALSREAGYRTNYHVTLPGRSSNVRSQDPFHIVRLKDDYIVRLPGAGRRSLGRVILEKFRRRLDSRDIY